MQSKLNKYKDLLIRWSQRHNMISRDTLHDVHGYHFIDCLALAEKIPANAVVVDLGSGAGLPAVVLAIVRDDIEVHAVESRMKRCMFLEEVKRELSLDNFHIHCSRIEDVDKFMFCHPHESGDLLEALTGDSRLRGNDNTANDVANLVITARFFASLKNIFDLSQKFSPNKYLLLKGNNLSSEMEEAKVNYSFDINTYSVNNTKRPENGTLIAEISEVKNA